jgi:uncharacterized membrane protein YccC
MTNRSDYLRQVQKFTSSQYWSAGVRITAGVMIPTLAMVNMGWLETGMSFLWGSLFVSLTDMPGPIHHRRNGMLAAISLNTVVVVVTLLVREYPVLLLTEITLFSFLFSLLGVYGSRAGAVGTLALVMMLLNFVPHHEGTNLLFEAVLVAGGGLWYTGLSLILYRLRPYRLAEQAIGEYLIEIASYVRARGALYKEDVMLQKAFDRIMQEQVEVQKAEEQTRELLFRTRQFVTDASPKSRSMMMIYLDSMDLFESSLLSYQNYELLHRNLHATGLLNRFYRAVLLLAAEIEHVGFRIQSGVAVRKNVDMQALLSALEDAVRDIDSRYHEPPVKESLKALTGTLSNIRNMANRMQRIVLYTRLESDALAKGSSLAETTKTASGHPLEWQTLKENLTLQSNHFRYSFRLTIAMLVGFALSAFFSLTHTYWVLLTILTILRPVYALTRQRNIERLTGTFLGGFTAVGLLTLITQPSALLVIMIISMMLAYSFLRLNYFSFVFFLTLFIILTFHFLHPMEIKSLIQERLVDTAIGSVIAWLAARFILPIWEHEQIENSLAAMLRANRQFFDHAWNTVVRGTSETQEGYLEARKNAIVALTNLSDKFQKMLMEPQRPTNAAAIHQMVIANHMLTGHIAALSPSQITGQPDQALTTLVNAVGAELRHAENQVLHQSTRSENLPPTLPVLSTKTLNPIHIIYSLSHDIRLISQRMQTEINR